MIPPPPATASEPLEPPPAASPGTLDASSVPLPASCPLVDSCVARIAAKWSVAVGAEEPSLMLLSLLEAFVSADDEEEEPLEDVDDKGSVELLNWFVVGGVPPLVSRDVEWFVLTGGQKRSE